MNIKEEKNHLYLDGRNTHCSVSLENDSIIINKHNESPLRHPLHRIDRITTLGDVNWQADAMAAIAQYGIVIGILNAHGSLKSVLMPCNRRRSSLSEQLDRLTRRLDWPDRLEDWRRSEISIHARALKFPDPAQMARMGWSGAVNMMINIANPATKAHRARFANQIRSFAEILAQKSLSEFGCPADWRGSDPDPEHNITPIFAQIALWRFARIIAMRNNRKLFTKSIIADQKTPFSPIGSSVMQTMEKFAKPLDRALKRDLLRLHRQLLYLNSDTGRWLPKITRRKKWDG